MAAQAWKSSTVAHLERCYHQIEDKEAQKARKALEKQTFSLFFCSECSTYSRLPPPDGERGGRRWYVSGDRSKEIVNARNRDMWKCFGCGDGKLQSLDITFVEIEMKVINGSLFRQKLDTITWEFGGHNEGRCNFTYHSAYIGCTVDGNDLQVCLDFKDTITFL